MSELRPKIVKLAKMVGGIAGVMNKIDENTPEYYSLDCVVTDEMADVALCMGLRKPRTFAYILEHSKKSQQDLVKLLDRLTYTGVVKCWTDKEDNKERYFVNIFAPGMLEMMVNNREQLNEFPQIGKAFEEYTRLRLAPMAAKFPQGMAMMRVLPVESAIKDIPDTKPWEHISYYLDKYDTFSVSDCSCRQSRRVIDEGCGHLEKDICVQMGEGAEYYIKTGRGKEITREEAKEILKFAEDNGLMHEAPHTDGLGESAAICNCCSCSCFSLRLATLFNTPDAIRSNFTAEVNTQNCVACGQCVETCPVNALKLGSKICATTDESTNNLKTARDHIWHKSEWNVDYRENKEDVLPQGTAPCKTTCPAHIAVQGYIRLASLGKYKEALELIKKENPFPAICGRICPHNCENECTRGEIDEPIAIDEIKKFIADQELNANYTYIPPMRYHLGNKVAIIGSGPAGLSCAYFLAIDGYEVTVFEKEEKLGGMLTLGIPSFRLEKEVIHAEIDVLRKMGVHFKTGVTVGKDITISGLKEEGYEAFYLAIGANGARKLNIEGEDAINVTSGVAFLKSVNLGQDVSLSGKVLVIGGGNVAIDVARTAARTGADSISLYCLEQEQEMPALDEEILDAKNDQVVFHNGWGPKKILTNNNKVVGVEFKKCTQVFDDSHHFSPIYDESNTIVVPADHVLLSIGQSIEWGELLDDTAVKLGRGNTASCDDFTLQTNDPCIFTGGDCATGPKFAIHAIAQGKEGAISIHRFVQPGQSLVYGRDKKQYHSFDKSNVDYDHLDYDSTRRQTPSHAAQKQKTFSDARVTFTEEQMKKETSRCLSCGAVQVDAYMCIGCGLCTTKCKFDAIHLKRTYSNQPDTYEKLPIKIAQNAIVRSGKIASTAIKEHIHR